MAVTWADVVLIAPELSTSAAGLQTLVLAIVDRQIDDDEWEQFADDGRLYLAAHIGSIAGGGSSPGAVTAETLGPMSRSYGLTADVSGSLGSTKYGVMYRYLLSLLPCSIGIVP